MIGEVLMEAKTKSGPADSTERDIVARHIDSLKAIGRFRKVPRWAPMRSLLFDSKRRKVIF